MPWQGLEIQASASSRASPLARRLGGWQPPSLSSWPPARSGKPCGGVAGGLLGASWAGFVHPRSGALSHGSGCCAKHPSPHQPVGVLMGSCLPGGTADGKCNQKGLFSWSYTSAEARLGTRWRGQDHGLCLCKVTAGGGAEGHSGCQHCPGCQGRLRRPPSSTPKPP